MDNSSVQSGRTWTGFDFAFLWFGAAICITEIWAGGLISGLGLVMGTIALIVGHIFGTLGLAYVSHLGAVTLKPTMEIVRSVFGRSGATLPTVLNIIQLVGWTAVMLVVAAEATKSLYADADSKAIWFIVIIGSGLLTTLWTILGARWWKAAQGIGFIILFILSIIMTVTVLTKFPLSTLRTQSTGDMGLMLGIDLAIAMPISWLPLAADYSRYASNRKGVAIWTFVGFFLGSVWLYWLGLVGKLATDTADPGALSVQLLGEYKLAIIAIIMIFVSTLTTTFLDIYSAAVSIKVMQPKLSEQHIALIIGLLGTLIALFFPIVQYESFLLFIGSFFVPVFGVVITAGLLGKINTNSLSFTKQYSLSAIIAWIIGFSVYIVASGPNLWPFSLLGKQLPPWITGWQIGASIPAFLASGLIYLILQTQKKATK